MINGWVLKELQNYSRRPEKHRNEFSGMSGLRDLHSLWTGSKGSIQTPITLNNILSPTRDLVKQCEEALNDVGKSNSVFVGSPAKKEMKQMSNRLTVKVFSTRALCLHSLSQYVTRIRFRQKCSTLGVYSSSAGGPRRRWSKDLCLLAKSAEQIWNEQICQRSGSLRTQDVSARLRIMDRTGFHEYPIFSLKLESKTLDPS